ncbi:hypothetical protein BDR03DRAFT_969168 [Suillus americanus]|nr:hypothetical protein BDR03DRAFT_969168 [Suillus americanus]
MNCNITSPSPHPFSSPSQKSPIEERTSACLQFQLPKLPHPFPPTRLLDPCPKNAYLFKDACEVCVLCCWFVFATPCH